MQTLDRFCDLIFEFSAFRAFFVGVNQSASTPATPTAVNRAFAPATAAGAVQQPLQQQQQRHQQPPSPPSPQSPQQQQTTPPQQPAPPPYASLVLTNGAVNGGGSVGGGGGGSGSENWAMMPPIASGGGQQQRLLNGAATSSKFVARARALNLIRCLKSPSLRSHQYSSSPYARLPLNHDANSAYNSGHESDVVPPRPPRQMQTRNGGTNFVQQPIYVARSSSSGAAMAAGAPPPPQQQQQQPPPPPPLTIANRSLKENRANILLQQLRDDGAQSESDVSTNDSGASTRRYFYESRVNGVAAIGAPPQPLAQSAAAGARGVVYLEFNREVKRSTLPPRLHSIDQLKSLFSRSFAALTPHYLSQPNIKIYIAETSGGGASAALFYELEDLR